MLFLPTIYLSWFEFVLDAMLKGFLFQFRVGYNKTVADKMSRIAMSFRGAKPIEIRLFFLDHSVGDWIDPKPGGDGKTVLIGPGFDRRQNDARTIAAGRVEEFIGSVSEWKIFEYIQEFHGVLFLDTSEIGEDENSWIQY